MATTTKRLYALASGLGLVERSNKDDPFHQLVYGLTGKEHVNDLTPKEANLYTDYASLNQRRQDLLKGLSER